MEMGGKPAGGIPPAARPKDLHDRCQAVKENRNAEHVDTR